MEFLSKIIKLESKEDCPWPPLAPLKTLLGPSPVKSSDEPRAGPSEKLWATNTGPGLFVPAGGSHSHSRLGTCCPKPAPLDGTRSFAHRQHLGPGRLPNSSFCASRRLAPFPPDQQLHPPNSCVPQRRGGRHRANQRLIGPSKPKPSQVPVVWRVEVVKFLSNTVKHLFSCVITLSTS